LKLLEFVIDNTCPGKLMYIWLYLN
jgi:hypothetical protein